MFKKKKISSAKNEVLLFSGIKSEFLFSRPSPRKKVVKILFTLCRMEDKISESKTGLAN